jgi:hypothetical protein
MPLSEHKLHQSKGEGEGGWGNAKSVQQHNIVKCC